MAEKTRSMDEKAADAKAFLDGIMDDAKRRGIPPEMTVTLFGYFAHVLINMRVENGESRVSVTKRFFDCFMQGLGMQKIDVDDTPDQRDLH